MATDINTSRLAQHELAKCIGIKYMQEKKSKQGIHTHSCQVIPHSTGASVRDKQAWLPIEKLANLGYCIGRPIICPSHAYPVGTRTTMKRTAFPRRFDKPDLNFQKLYTQGDTSMPVDFCRHLVGGTLINVCHCDST